MSRPGRPTRPRWAGPAGRGLRTEARWWLGRHRRPLAAALAALAVWAGVGAARVGPAAGVAVLAAGRDLAAGTTLSPADLGTVRLPTAAVPAGALTPGDPVTGRVLTGPLRRGEPLTDVRLAIALLLPAGTEAVPLRLADAGAAAVISAGDHIDVLATAGTDAAGFAAAGTPGPVATAGAGRSGSSAPTAALVAAGLVVLSAPAAAGSGGGLLGSSGGASASSGDGGLLVVAATESQAAALAGAAAVDQLSVTVVPPGAGIGGAG